jgi:uncharacterized protein YdhG (YjbR/CyaY superfamily)
MAGAQKPAAVRSGSPRRALEGAAQPDDADIPAIVDRYIAGLPPDQQVALEDLRRRVAAVAPDAVEALSYGMPAFRYHDRSLLWYIGAKAHCSLFPTAAVIDAHRAELAGYTLSKGTIQFTPEHPLPADLVASIVRDRMARIDRGEKP